VASQLKVPCWPGWDDADPAPWTAEHTNPSGQRTSRKSGAGKTTMMIIIIGSGSSQMIANV